MAKTLYDRSFYDTQSGGSYDSASAVAPVIVDLLQPESVLDIGCGVGTWLKAFEEAGVGHVHGLDGPWVDAGQLLIRPDQFTAIDLAAGKFPIEPRLPRPRYDLVTTFEFLEHAPASQASPILDFIARVTDQIVLGAALPGQGGTGHLNEQWVDYWADLLRPHGFVAYDFLRPIIWNDARVASWYKQNSVGFFRGAIPERVVQRAQEVAIANLSSPQRVVHPGLFELKANNHPWRLTRRIVKHVIGRR